MPVIRRTNRHDRGLRCPRVSRRRLVSHVVWLGGVVRHVHRQAQRTHVHHVHCGTSRMRNTRVTDARPRRRSSRVRWALLRQVPVPVPVPGLARATPASAQTPSAAASVSGCRHAPRESADPSRAAATRGRRACIDMSTLRMGADRRLVRCGAGVARRAIAHGATANHACAAAGAWAGGRADAKARPLQKNSRIGPTERQARPTDCFGRKLATRRNPANC